VEDLVVDIHSDEDIVENILRDLVVPPCYPLKESQAPPSRERVEI
jgi:hypothetical protein